MKVQPVVQRKFKKRRDGFYQELWIHSLKITKADGNIEFKQDHEELGAVYREGTVYDQTASNTFVEWEDEQTGIKKILVAITSQPKGVRLHK